MNHTVYLKLSQITELTHKDVVLKDVAQVYCDDQNVMNKCNSMKVMTVKVDAKRRYIMSALDVINKLKQLDSTIDVNNVGETDFIIAYKPPSPPAYIWQWTKTVFVCLVCFFGAAFAIMTFNNDVSVTDVFSEVFGVGCKIFTIAGPVILYGVLTSWVLGLIYWVGRWMGIF